jgi:hypothetical protein
MDVLMFQRFGMYGSEVAAKRDDLRQQIRYRRHLNSSSCLI